MTEAARSPHIRMSELDSQGVDYTVTFNFIGFPQATNREVFSHSDDWLEVSSEKGGREWINIRHLARLQINVF